MTAVLSPSGPPGPPAGDPPDPARPARPRWPLSARYVFSRLLNAVLAVWAVLTIVFFAMHMTGNPANLLLPIDAGEEEIARLTAALGFADPLPEQYLRFLGQVLTGQFPDSIRYGGDPVALVLERLPATLLLGTWGMIIGASLGLAAGAVATFGRSRRWRRVPISVLTALEAVPSFFLGIVLIAVFSIALSVLPLRGAGSPAHLVLPAVVIGLALAAPVARVFRTSLQESTGAEHVRLAEAKGIGRAQVVLRHIVVNALAPVLNVLGVQAGVVLGGAVVTEAVFGWPGVGQLATSAIDSRDFPVVLACVALIAIGFVLVNLLVDLVAAILDPRGGHR